MNDIESKLALAEARVAQMRAIMDRYIASEISNGHALSEIQSALAFEQPAILAAVETAGKALEAILSFNLSLPAGLRDEATSAATALALYGTNP